MRAAVPPLPVGTAPRRLITLTPGRNRRSSPDIFHAAGPGPGGEVNVKRREILKTLGLTAGKAAVNPRVFRISRRFTLTSPPGPGPAAWKISGEDRRFLPGVRVIRRRGAVPTGKGGTAALIKCQET